MNVKENVLNLLVDICASKSIKNDLEMDLIKGGYLDSMGIVSLITELEDEFDVEIPLDKFNLDDFNTAQKIINYVSNNL